MNGLIWFTTKEKNRYKDAEYSYRDGGKWYVNISLCEGQPDKSEFIVASGKTLQQACDNLMVMFKEKKSRLVFPNINRDNSSFPARFG